MIRSKRCLNSLSILLFLILLPFSYAAFGLNCPPAKQELMPPPTLVGGTYLKSVLAVRTVDKCINGKTVALKSYIDERAGTDHRPVGPAYILDVEKGGAPTTLELQLTNDLGPCAGDVCDCGHNGADVNICTNYHTHGLHVSPAGNSDNVLLTLQPGTVFDYQFSIPSSHAPGTHWTHAHLHGSTSTQVSEGMSGALLLKGETDAWLESIGTIDNIMILQQLSKNNDGDYLCNYNDSDGEKVEIETSINGQCQPYINATSGSLLRFRLIHAGISASIYFAVQTETGVSQPIHEFARDGINMGYLSNQRSIELQPGYRSDVLFQVPACPQGQNSCSLYIVDAESAGFRSLLGVAEDQDVIATLNITAGTKVTSLPPADDSHFAKPYSEIEDSELVKEEIDIYFATRKLEDENYVPDANPTYTTYQTVNGEVYNPDNPINLTLGQAQTWRVWTQNVDEKNSENLGPSHPYHIHVNPFEVIKRDDRGNITERFWKDTYLISSSENRSKDEAVELRARYETFIGDFVMHCHNLSHEDKGMMKKISMKLDVGLESDSHH